MALKATIFKAELQVSDLDRAHYGTYGLTLARHPSETDERMMVRLVAFALNAGERLEFGRGLSADDEPDLWQRDLTGTIETWIDVGLPDPRRVRKAAGRAARVVVYAYGGRSVDVWWRQAAADLERLPNVAVFALSQEATEPIAALATRSMRLQCMIQDGEAWFGDESGSIALEPSPLKVFASTLR